MEQKSLAKWLKLILIGMALCGAVIYALVIPYCGKSLTASYPEFENRFWPWLIFLWGTGIPCYAVLALGWKIADRIGQDQSFTFTNAQSLKWIAWLAAGDAGVVFLGNLLLLFLNMSHPGVALFMLPVVFVGIAVAVAAAALSHLVKKAAVLQEQSDLTI